MFYDSQELINENTSKSNFKQWHLKLLFEVFNKYSKFLGEKLTSIILYKWKTASIY